MTNTFTEIEPATPTLLPPAPEVDFAMKLDCKRLMTCTFRAFQSGAELEWT